MRIAAEHVGLIALIATGLLAAVSAMEISGPSGGPIPAQIRIALCSEPDAARTLFGRGPQHWLRATDEGDGELTPKAAVNACAPVAATPLPANGAKVAGIRCDDALAGRGIAVGAAQLAPAANQLRTLLRTP